MSLKDTDSKKIDNSDHLIDKFVFKEENQRDEFHTFLHKMNFTTKPRNVKTSSQKISSDRRKKIKENDASNNLFLWPPNYLPVYINNSMTGLPKPHCEAIQSYFFPDDHLEMIPSICNYTHDVKISKSSLKSILEENLLEIQVTKFYFSWIQKSYPLDVYCLFADRSTTHIFPDFHLYRETISTWQTDSPKFKILFCPVIYHNKDQFGKQWRLYFIIKNDGESYYFMYDPIVTNGSKTYILDELSKRVFQHFDRFLCTSQDNHSGRSIVRKIILIGKACKKNEFIASGENICFFAHHLVQKINISYRRDRRRVSRVFSKFCELSFGLDETLLSATSEYFFLADIKEYALCGEENVKELQFGLYNLIQMLNNLNDDSSTIKFDTKDEVFSNFKNLLLRRKIQNENFSFVRVSGPIPVMTYPTVESNNRRHRFFLEKSIHKSIDTLYNNQEKMTDYTYVLYGHLYKRLHPLFRYLGKTICLIHATEMRFGIVKNFFFEFTETGPFFLKFSYKSENSFQDAETILIEYTHSLYKFPCFNSSPASNFPKFDTVIEKAALVINCMKKHAKKYRRYFRKKVAVPRSLFTGKNVSQNNKLVLARLF